MINFDEMDPGASGDNLNLSIPPDTLANLMYTSGSTGQPKGVMGRHCDVIHEIMRYTNQIHLYLEDRQALVTDASIGGSTRGIFGSLLNGAAVLSFNLAEDGMANLADWIAQEEITVYRSAATTYRQFVNAITDDHEFPKLRLIHVGGEPVYKSDVELYKKCFAQGCIFLNALGITETLGVRNYFMDKETQLSSGIVPVGYAVEGVEILMLDDDGKRMGFDQIGEIAVKSRYISPGYWRRPDLTHAKFLPAPDGGDERIYLTGDLGLMKPDGLLIHMGRKDFQVKIRGYRVEVAEVEAALLNLDTIEEAAVVARDDQSGEKRLIAYLVPNRQSAPTVTVLRRALAEVLPNYMIPFAFVMMGELPHTATGKIDRLALPKPGTSRPELDTPFVAPRTPMEKEVAEIWSQVLGIDQVGVHDSFFDLGGHSLLATQIVSRVISTFQIKLSLKSLFRSPTIEDMAVAIMVLTAC